MTVSSRFMAHPDLLSFKNQMKRIKGGVLTPFPSKKLFEYLSMAENLGKNIPYEYIQDVLTSAIEWETVFGSRLGMNLSKSFKKQWKLSCIVKIQALFLLEDD